MKIYLQYVLLGICLYVLVSLFFMEKKVILFKHPVIIRTKDNQYYMKINNKRINLEKKLIK